MYPPLTTITALVLICKSNQERTIRIYTDYGKSDWCSPHFHPFTCLHQVPKARVKPTFWRSSSD